MKPPSDDDIFADIIAQYLQSLARLACPKREPGTIAGEIYADLGKEGIPVRWPRPRGRAPKLLSLAGRPLSWANVRTFSDPNRIAAAVAAMWIDDQRALGIKQPRHEDAVSYAVAIVAENYVKRLPPSPRRGKRNRKLDPAIVREYLRRERVGWPYDNDGI